MQQKRGSFQSDTSSKASSASNFQSNNPSHLIALLRAFEVKVDAAYNELSKQNVDDELVKSQRLYKWLMKMNEYLRGLCSGFRARLLAPMSQLPAMKQQIQPLSSTMLAAKQLNRQANGTYEPEIPIAIDIHRVYHSLKSSVIVVPELLLVTHLFPSNQVFCDSLSELLLVSEKDLWQQPITEKNCSLHLNIMLASVRNIKNCCKIADDWLRQLVEEKDSTVPEVNRETARLQRLVNCQNLIKARLDVFADETSSIEFDLIKALDNLQPLLELQEFLEDVTNSALEVNESVIQTNRRIQAIEGDILKSNAQIARKNVNHEKPIENAMPPIERTDSPKIEDSSADEAKPDVDPLTISQICHREIFIARNRLNTLDYLWNLHLDDAEEICVTMPFVVRQSDYLQSIADKLEADLEAKRQTHVHLQETLAFINQEVECATYLCGQVNLGGFTGALGTASVNASLETTTVTQQDELQKAFSDNNDENNPNKKQGQVVYIKKRSQSRQSHNSSENN